MNAGLPGTGLGGLFYVLMALWMPFHELVVALRGRRQGGRWGIIGLEVGFALAIAFAAWGTYWLVGFLLNSLAEASTSFSPVLSTAASAANDRMAGLLPVAPVVLTLITLLGVLLGVEVLRLIVRHSGSLHFPGFRFLPPSSGEG